MLLRNCGKSVTPQRADVGIGPYAHYWGAAGRNGNMGRSLRRFWGCGVKFQFIGQRMGLQ
ncbi:MAG: hypothetical protein ACI3W5_05580 [Faecousia sp.]